MMLVSVVFLGFLMVFVVLIVDAIFSRREVTRWLVRTQEPLWPT
jgi:hypothetical protein